MVSRVVQTAMVAHLWAQQSQDFARTSIPSANTGGHSWQSGASMWEGSPRTWFRGAVLYSYNEPIARIVPGADGKPRALLTAGRPDGDVWNPAHYQKWSVATSNHMPGRLTESQAVQSFSVPSIAGRPASGESHAEFDRDIAPAAPDHGLNLEFLRTAFRNAVRRFGNVAGVPEWHRTDYLPSDEPGDYGSRAVVRPVAEYVEGALVAAWEAANDYQAAFAVSVPTGWQVATEWPADLAAVQAIAAPLGERLTALEAKRNTPEAIQKREAAQAKAKATKERRENLRWRGTPAERIAEWRAGGPADILKHGERLDSDGGALLRVRGKKLETSQGADVPLADAIKVFRFVKLCRERGTEWRRNGARIPVGGFQVDVIKPNGDFVAGCHRINWPEIVSAATMAGVLDMVPNSEAVQGGGHG